MIKTSIETISGKLCTVIWYGEKNVNIKGIHIYLEDAAFVHTRDNCVLLFDTECHIATALPALPKNPKPSDARLLYRYMAEGIVPMGLQKIGYGTKSRYVEKAAVKLISESYKGGPREITHAIDRETGERLEIAIKESV